jgi:hypothetical protein
MPPFGRDDLLILNAAHESPCVSFFLPTHRHLPQREKDPVRLRNLLRDGLARLSAIGFSAGEELLEPVRQLADSADWGPPRDGLAVFRSLDFFAYHSLPVPLREQVVVADSFHVRPLLRFLQASERYYLLALSQKRVRLFEGTPFSLSPVEADLPGSLEDALGSEHDESFLNVRSASRGTHGALYHGHGDAEGAREEDLRRFFRVVDAAVWQQLRGDQAPLFLAGITRHIPLYRELSRYPFVPEQGIEGNVDELAADELRERAQPLVEEWLRARRSAQVKELAAARGRGLATLDLEAIGKHAAEGRVHRLLLSEGQRTPGQFDVETGRIHSAADLSDDVLDDLAQAVLLRDGEVTTLPAEEMPEGAAAAAVLRW